MADVLAILTSITIILLVGLISIFVSKKTKLPLALILFSFGVILGNLFYLEKPIIQISGEILSAFSIFALIVVLFDSMSKLRLDEFNHGSIKSIFFFIVALLLNVFVLSFFMNLLLGIQTLVSILFALLISCVEFTVIYARNHSPKTKITSLLKEESTISSAFAVLIPFFILSVAQFMTESGANLLSNLIPFIINFFAGVGVGLIMTLVLLKLLHIKQIQKVHSLLLLFSILVAYLFAQQIQGNGIIAVAVTGFFFGNVLSRYKSIIKSDLDKVYSVLELFIFILAGVVVGIPLSFDFFRISLALFFVFLLLRFIASLITLRNYDFYEKLETTLFVPKGVTTVTVAFALLNYSFFGAIVLVQLLLAFFVYSLLLDHLLDTFGFFTNRRKTL